MKICKGLLSLLACLIFLVACGPPTDEEVFYEVQKKLGELQTYECTASISVKNENQTQEYIYKQYFSKPNKYRLEVVSPEAAAGNLMISNGKSAWIHSPTMNYTYKIDSMEKQQKEVLFIGYFLNTYMSSKEVDIQKETMDGVSYVVITSDIPGGNYYFSKQELWVDFERYLPAKLNIFNQEDNLLYTVKYEEFKYNTVLEDKLFYLDTTE
ncbi:outer membrane lipoprotein-sorting protein [Serpentinicella sp. ANB-PHB4]|uniref:LolA family protein n=1 Tax=Serpentinicella sp. ANB-PHB4 TaxID=3074076 RepID=UPI002859310E|nr:outer membrane lipoprotein-sorting protein [Serpentinicella sp. ANB-PHB4]MDR5659350.1 outer membrane lipoprotein-sorting protein [Serpentinicella sp. ANB-PHB4]